MAKARQIILAISASCFVACSSFLLWSFYYRVEAEQTPFSPTKWKEKANVYALSNDPGCVRGDMALDIVAANLLYGKLITEVKSLLGEPDETKEFGVYYELGQCSGFGWYNSVLQVNFGRNQQVSNAVILRH
jgi:hypothetical protein